MKKIYILFLSVLMLFSCTPTTKEAYMSDYKNFIENLSEESSSYDDSDWKRAERKYELYSGEWYDMFGGELTIKEKITVKGYGAKFKYLYAAGKAKGTVNNVMDALDGEDDRSEIEKYIEEDLEDDIEKLGEEAEKLGEDLVDEIKDLTEGL